MHGNFRGSSLLAVLLIGCEPKTSTDDELGDTSQGESESSSSTASDTSTSSDTSSESDTSTSSDTTTTETSESETTEGDPDFELIPANADWFESTRSIAHRRLGDAEQLLLGGFTGISAEPPLDEAGVLAINLDGTTRWKSIEPWSFRLHTVHSLAPLPEGGTWLTGGTYDEKTIADGPGWIWIGALDFAGSWTWLIDTPYGNLPESTAVRPDGSAAILHWVFFGYGMHDFSATGEHAWSLDAWGTENQLPEKLVAVPGGVVAGGYEAIGDIFEPSEQWLWFRRVSDAGEPLDDVVHPGPAGALDDVATMRFDDAALTVEVLVQRHTNADPQALWLTLDPDDLSLLATRELGPGSPRGLELDGSGGAWIVIVDEGGRSLYRFDADGSPIQATPISNGYGLAFDHQGARAYLLLPENMGIEIVPL